MDSSDIELSSQTNPDLGAAKISTKNVPVVVDAHAYECPIPPAENFQNPRDIVGVHESLVYELIDDEFMPVLSNPECVVVPSIVNASPDCLVMIDDKEAEGIEHNNNIIKPAHTVNEYPVDSAEHAHHFFNWSTLDVEHHGASMHVERHAYFPHTSTSIFSYTYKCTYIYIYIYMCVCMCVCHA